MMRILRAAFAVLIVMGLIAAGLVFLTQRAIEVDAYKEVAIAPRPTIDLPDAGLKFSILPTATLTAPEGAMFEGGNWLKQRTMNHSAVLICHPHAFVLFDTGLGRDIDSQFGEFPFITRMAFGYRKLTAAADVIAKADPCPGRPLIIIPSHLHWDHAGGIEDFPNADVWIQSMELQQARSGGVGQGFLPGEIDAKTIKWKPFSFSEKPYEQFRRSLDVFGDGSLILVPMIGHTAGSVGLFITAGGRRYFLTGDTTWAVEGFTRPAHKFFAARAIADLDLPQMEAEIVGVHRLMARDPDLIVIPAHDAAAYPANATYPYWAGHQE
ncbi:MAG: MBL fold metallo-hydrolase [Micropepsaceae bacterium]